MYKTESVDAVVSITELRVNTTEIIDALNDDTRFVGIQRNNEPVAVLVSWATYQKLRPFIEDQDE